MAISFLEMFPRINLSEQRKFEQYVHGVHDPNEQIVRAFDYINPLIQKKKAINEEAMFEYVLGYPPDKSKKQPLRPLQNIMHDLKTELLDYFAWQEYRKNKNKGPALLLRLEAIQHKGMADLYAEQVQLSRRAVQKRPVTALWDMFEDLMVHQHYLYHATPDVWDEQAESVLDELIDILDQLYVATSWKYRVERTHQIATHGNNNRQTPQDMDRLTSLTEDLKQQTQPIELYSSLYRMLNTNDQQIFEHLRNKILPEMPMSEDCLVVVTSLINFKIRQISGDAQSQKEVFDLFRFALDRNIFLSGGFLPLMVFHNIVNLACQSGRLTWAKDFIESYSRKLPFGEREDAKTLALAKWQTEQMNYKEALDYLEQYKGGGIAEDLQSRLYKVRILYELNRQKSLETALANLEQFARRNNLKSVKRERIKCFIQIVTGLMKKTPPQALRAKMEKCPALPMRLWLQQKIGQTN